MRRTPCRRRLSGWAPGLCRASCAAALAPRAPISDASHSLSRQAISEPDNLHFFGGNLLINEDTSAHQNNVAWWVLWVSWVLWVLCVCVVCVCVCVRACVRVCVRAGVRVPCDMPAAPPPGKPISKPRVTPRD